MLNRVLVFTLMTVLLCSMIFIQPTSAAQVEHHHLANEAEHIKLISDITGYSENEIERIELTSSNITTYAANTCDKCYSPIIVFDNRYSIYQECSQHQNCTLTTNLLHHQHVCSNIRCGKFFESQYEVLSKTHRLSKKY